LINPLIRHRIHPIYSVQGIGTVRSRVASNSVLN